MTIAWIFCYIGVGTAVHWLMKLVDWIDREDRSKNRGAR